MPRASVCAAWALAALRRAARRWLRLWPQTRSVALWFAVLACVALAGAWAVRFWRGRGGAPERRWPLVSTGGEAEAVCALAQGDPARLRSTRRPLAADDRLTQCGRLVLCEPRPVDGGALVEQLVAHDAFVGRLVYQRKYVELSPVVTLFTSVLRGGEFIATFLRELPRQTAWRDCEHLVALVETGDGELHPLLSHVAAHANSALLVLDRDPGLYQLWNLLVACLARGEFVSNANVDDGKHPRAVELKLALLRQHPKADIAASGVLVSGEKNLAWDEAQRRRAADPAAFPTWYDFIDGEVRLERMFRYDSTGRASGSENFPHCAPLWRRSLSFALGHFNVSRSPIADYDLWLRALRAGHRVWATRELLELYYRNPLSVSARQDEAAARHLAELFVEFEPLVYRKKQGPPKDSSASRVGPAR